MNKQRAQHGQVLLEALIAHTLQWIFVAVVGIAMFGVFADALLHADAYSLARSSLYGTPRRCAPAKEWPKFSLMNIRYQCPGAGVVRAEIYLHSTVSFKHRIDVALRGSL